VQRAKFFANLHCDNMVLSGGRSYGTQNKFILVAIDQLSRYVFLRSCYSTQFEHQRVAWDDIFKSLKEMGYGDAVEVAFHDGGPEFNSHQFRAYLSEKKIRSNLIGQRPYRLSKNSPYAEAAIRRIRMHLEENLSIKKGNETFKHILARTESQCNSEQLSSIGMSANDALNHDANYVVLVSKSKTLGRRKHLKNELKNKTEIKTRTVVRIRKYTEKQFRSTAKESYGHLSKLYVVKEVDYSRPICTYRVADLFSLECIKGSFSAAELECVNVDYLEACENESLKLKKIVSLENGIVRYNVDYCDRLFCANESLVC